MKLMKLLQNLNENQRAAVTSTEGPVLVIAGAGSGKTRTLTHRAAYLIEVKKIKPANILAVTFTNKAAGEMKKRIAELLSKISKNNTYSIPHIGTFHSICVQILRREIDNLGYKKSFNIFDDQDQKALISKVFKESEINKDQFTPNSILWAISKAKNELLDENQFEASANGYYEETVSKVYKKYQQELKIKNALDFDDLIRLTVKLLRDFPKVLEKYQDLFKYIMVDEYQDTNHAQYTLVSLLSKKYKNIWVCGDDFQSIYGWRQADIRNILNFEKDFQNAQTIKLEQNYRSTQIILDAANEVISKNINQKEKKIWTEKKEGHLITSYEAEDEKDESNFISREILSSLKENGGNKSTKQNLNSKNYKDFAVLYRTNAQSRMIEESFLKHSIPYRIVGGIKFYQRKEVKDIIAYIRLIQDSNDIISLERSLNEPRRGIGKASLEKWLSFSREKDLDLITTGTDLSTSVLPKKKTLIIKSFCELIQEMRELSEKNNLSKLIRKVFEKSGYLKVLDELGEEGEVRKENIEELLSVSKKYKENTAKESLPTFLEEVALSSDTDKINKDENSVHLMTLHSAKGLEFPTIFIAGLEEGILPHSRSMLNQSEMEEERRLMYVGITRAEEKVYLLFTNMRTIFGSTQSSPPSRFLDDIPTHLIEENTQPAFNNNYEYEEKSISYDENPDVDIKENKSFKDGDRVSHSEFGEGLVISNQDSELTIAFKNTGIKKLSSQYAKLKKI